MENEKEFPFVSALLVTRNEKDYIKISLMSLIEQTYPKDKYEIIVIDKKPSNPAVDILLDFPYSSYDRNYVSDNLNHDVITLYF